MLVLLPPSETKRPGGRDIPLDLASLALPELRPQRERAIAALVSLSAHPDEAARILRLSARQRHEIAVNAALREGPTLAAVDRYTGVLYDALAVASLGSAARRWLGEHVLIHSAPFGPVGALDAIPAYRMSAGAALPALGPQRALWADAVTAALRGRAPSFVLDLRSEAYVALGPVPAEAASAYVRVVAEGPDGALRALTHVNKHAKGALVRLLAEDRPRVRRASAFLAWAERRGIALSEAEPGVLTLRVDNPGNILLEQGESR